MKWVWRICARHHLAQSKRAALKGNRDRSLVFFLKAEKFFQRIKGE